MEAPSSFTASFDYTYTDPEGNPADGFSFCFGPDPGGIISDVGGGVAHVIRFDIYASGTQPNGVISYRKNGLSVASNTTALHRLNDRGVAHPIVVSLTGTGLLTVKYKGSTILNSLQTGYTYTPGDRIFFGSRTGGSSAEQSIDNLKVLPLPPDIGATEALSGPINAVVSSLLNSGDGTLRDILAAVPTESSLTFHPSLSGGTIPLASASGAFVVTKAVTIDALSLPAGIKLNGALQNFRIFQINNGASLTLRGMTLTGGGGNTFNLDGGAIENSGDLLLTRCTLSDNRVGTGADGGALYNNGTATLDRCTLSGNSSLGFGGAIENAGNVALLHCTLASNSAGAGGAIRNSPGVLTINRSIVAGNSPDNVVGTFTGSNNLTSGDPLLAPLGNYGGGTQTRALLPGSAARNGATGSAITQDQRAFPILGIPDIGAYESGNFSNYNAWIWETLPSVGNGSVNDPLHAATFDHDGDGQTNFNEWIARTDPLNPSSSFRVIQQNYSAGNFELTFPSILGRSYQVQSSPNLGTNWANVGTALHGTGSIITVTTIGNNAARFFFRVVVGDP